MNDMIAVVGAGGKTTWIHQQAEKYRQSGKRVLITTTTHMVVEKDMLLWIPDMSADVVVSMVERLFENNRIVVIGQLCKMKEHEVCQKFKGLPADIYEAVIQCADVVLIEADGSRSMPLKYPAMTEPVLPEKLTKAVVIMGGFGKGERIDKVLHRWELACQDDVLSPLSESDLSTEELIQRLFHVYNLKIKKVYPELEIYNYLSDRINGEMTYEKF